MSSIPSQKMSTTMKTFISFSLWDNEGNMQNFMVLVTAKNTNLPSFLALTPERKVQLTCAWPHFVGLIELQILICLGTLKHVSMLRYWPKTLKFRMMSIKLLLMLNIIYQKDHWKQWSWKIELPKEVRIDIWLIFSTFTCSLIIQI